MRRPSGARRRGRRIRRGSDAIRRRRSSGDAVALSRASLRAEGLRQEKMSAGGVSPSNWRSSSSVKLSLKKSRSSRVMPACESDAFTLRQVVQRAQV